MLRTKILTLIEIASLMFISGCQSQQPASSNSSGTQSANKTVASDPIPDLPDYPAATRTAYTTSSDSAQGFSKSVRAELTTSDPFDKVIEFYKLDNLSRRGWKPLEVKSTAASAEESGITISLAQGASTAKIEIMQRGKGNVVITLERRDK